MASLKFDFFKTGTTESNHVGSRRMGIPQPTASLKLRRARIPSLNMPKIKVSLYPSTAPKPLGSLDSRKRRGRRVTVDPEVVKVVHKLYVNDDVPIQKIVFRVYETFKEGDTEEGLVLKPEAITAILKAGTRARS